MGEKMKFSKAYEPNQYEADIYALWEKSGAFERKTDGDKSDPYTIVMPPPNANGNLHIGHGLTIALEDILTRYHRLKGEDTWYIPGADHAGFETWVVYERKLEAEGKTRFDYSRDELYDQVWNFVAEQRGNMELQLRALGASCSWNDLVFALDDKVVNVVYNTFEKFWKKGLIYRGKKLVNYCTKHQTAFADIEVTHKEEKGKLWSIAYPLVNPTDELKEVVIATTRPETLLGDTAVAVNPEDPRYKKFIGQELILPLTNRTIKLIADEHADMEYGTGAVKITPAHDQNDYEVGERHNLDMITVIGFDGKMNENAGKYEGMTTAECRKAILNDLEELGLRRGEQEITHEVGHCYKCDTVIEPLLKEQWFVDMKPLAKKAIETLKAGKIKFHPANKQKVLINYLENLKDWNISRQIPWGIPIPAFQNVDDPTDWIFDTRVNEPEIVSEGKTYRRDPDTFDTWFSSSQWPYITTSDSDKHFPTSVMETGADLLFQWVGRMIMMSLFVKDDIPFKEVYMHGMVLDEHGQKMSKSKGNVINPIDVVSQYGSDALRLGLIASRSAGVNQAFSTSKVIASRNLCKKLWNVSRLIQSIVDENEDQSKPEKASLGENWIRREINRTNKELDKLLKNYRFAEAGDLLYDLIWNKYADWFLECEKLWKNVDLLKDSLEKVLIMLHPFAPFVTETIWQTLSWTDGLLISQNWPELYEKVDTKRAKQFDELIAIVSDIRSHFQNLPGANAYPVAFHDDELMYENQLLIQHLTKAPSVPQIDVADAKGLRLAIAGHNIYLQIPEDIHKKYKANLEDRILKLGAEINTLEARLRNPKYVEKAPKELVDETRDSLETKSRLLEKMKAELELV